jgi:hypothetical protein
MERAVTTVVHILSLRTSLSLCSRHCRCWGGDGVGVSVRAMRNREMLTNRILPTRLLRSEDLNRDSNCTVVYVLAPL